MVCTRSTTIQILIFLTLTSLEIYDGLFSDTICSMFLHVIVETVDDDLDDGFTVDLLVQKARNLYFWHILLKGFFGENPNRIRFDMGMDVLNLSKGRGNGDSQVV